MIQGHMSKGWPGGLRGTAAALAAVLPMALLWGNAAAEVVVGVVVALFLVRTCTTRDVHWLRQDWIVLALALWAYVCLRGALTPDPVHGVLHALPWIRFPLFAATLAYFALTEGRHQRWLLLGLFVALVSLATDAIIQYFYGTDLIGHRPQGTRLTAFFNAPKVGTTLCWLFLPVLLGLIGLGKRAMAILFGGLCLAAILLSGDRMALLTALLGCALVPVFVRRIRKYVLPLVLLLALPLGGLLYSNPSLYNRQVALTLEEIRNFSTTHYGEIWGSTLDIAKDYPLFGVGLKNYRLVCTDPHYGPEIRSFYPRCTTHPHNLYLEWLVEAGAVGLTGFLLCMVGVLRRMFLALRALPAGGPAGGEMVLSGLFITLLIRLWPITSSTSLFHGWSGIPFWLIVGWGLACAHRAAPPPPE